MRLSQIAELITDGLGPVGQALINLLVRKGARVITRAHQMHEEVGQESWVSAIFNNTFFHIKPM